MTLRNALFAAMGGAAADQWLEYFSCDSLPQDTLAVRARKWVRSGGRVAPRNDNIISNGSRIAVADGQCMMIVEQGRILDVCAQPGEYVFNLGSEASLLGGGYFEENAFAVLKDTWDRFRFGGQAGKDTRVYFFNTKELLGNAYGTPRPVPFRTIDKNIGLDMEIAIRFFGKYSYRISNPILFYRNVTGNFADKFMRSQVDQHLKSEVLGALQLAVARISAKGIRYSELPGHARELGQAVNEVLAPRMRDQRGLEITSFEVASVTARAEDEKLIRDLQHTAVLRDPTMAAAQMIRSQSSAIEAAAANESGSMVGFAGLGMANHAFRTANPSNSPTHSTPAVGHHQNHPSPQVGMGTKPPANPALTAPGWRCKCGQTSRGKFCGECGTPKPAGVSQYRCDKCSWVPPDPTQPTKFCPECGDPFDDGDIV